MPAASSRTPPTLHSSPRGSRLHLSLNTLTYSPHPALAVPHPHSPHPCALQSHPLPLPSTSRTSLEYTLFPCTRHTAAALAALPALAALRLLMRVPVLHCQGRGRPRTCPHLPAALRSPPVPVPTHPPLPSASPPCKVTLPHAHTRRPVPLAAPRPYSPHCTRRPTSAVATRTSALMITALLTCAPVLHTRGRGQPRPRECQADVPQLAALTGRTCAIHACSHRHHTLATAWCVLTEQRIWLGPRPGLKHLAREAVVPYVPRCEGLAEDDAAALRQHQLSLMLKASAGGGGMGMSATTSTRSSICLRA
ncbi:hypothetical protein GGX14DRAFT_573170 [Mycena pura]|uniref:Uncharacterized protein n=1 Tax=Mycena pura TaxID=153505 RepID=A0AAD6UZE0_9AGAR|nr:hypothetical protein GGX14DRAFT_573170 [Mycena pura]